VNRLLALSICFLLASCGPSPRTAMGECENEAQKALAGKVFTSESLRTQLEAQRRELVRSCMVSKGFKFNVAKFETDRSAVPEPLRVSRRPVGVSHAALADSSSC